MHFFNKILLFLLYPSFLHLSAIVYHYKEIKSGAHKENKAQVKKQQKQTVLTIS